MVCLRGRDADGISIALVSPSLTPGGRNAFPRGRGQSSREFLAHLEAVGWKECLGGGPHLQFPTSVPAVPLQYSPPPLGTSAPGFRLRGPPSAGALGKADPVPEVVKIPLPTFIFVEHSVT